MKIQHIILVLVIGVVFLMGCSERVLQPLNLSDTDIYVDFNSPIVVKILSGNGGYTIRPKTTYYYRGGEGERSYTISQDHVRTTIIGDSVILFERISIPDESSGIYTVFDSEGLSIDCLIRTPGWLGGL